MRSTFARLVVPIALLAAACSKGGAPSAGVSDELLKDLEAASAAKPELASQAGDYKPMRFVSELEQSNGAAEVQRSRTPRRVATRSTSVTQSETNAPAPEPQQEIQVAQLPAPEAQAPAPAPSDVPTVPIVAPRPAPMPVDMPATGGYGTGGMGTGSGDGRGVQIGDVIGVVIRGGGVGPDHCPPRRRGRRPVGIGGIGGILR